MYLGSDAIALAPFYRHDRYLEDGDVTVVRRQGIDFLNAKGEFLDARQPKSPAGRFRPARGWPERIRSGGCLAASRCLLLGTNG